MSGKRSKWWLGLFAGATVLAARAGSRFVRPRSPWYRALSKPAGQPPPWIFGPVWAALYGLMSVSAYRVVRTPRSPERTRALSLWWSQLATNAAWTPLFFGARRGRLALADLAATIVATGAYINEARRVDLPAAWMMTPYLSWLGYAGYLNGALVAKNPRLLA
jgi:tryptophan-rich sensory protein